MTRTFQLAAATAAAAVLSLSVPAMASPSFTVSPQAGGIHDGVGHVKDMKINGYGVLTTANKKGSATVDVGGFAVSANSGDLAGDFIAWCLDVGHTLNLASKYHVTDTPFEGKTLSNTVLDNLTKLANTAYSTVQASIGDKAVSAGFQLALWEIITETKGSYDLTKGTFTASAATSGKTNKSESNAAIAQGNAFLAGLDGPVTGNYELTYLQSEKSKGKQISQDLVTISALPPVSQVPLPAAGLLLIGALGGLGVFARRRKMAA